MRRRLIVKPGPGSVVSSRHGVFGKAVSDDFTITGDFDFEVEDLDRYVQVRTGGYSLLTYRDPAGTLQVGDYVTVPLGYRDTPSLGEVVKLGRGGYNGPTKDVTARLVAEVL